MSVTGSPQADREAIRAYRFDLLLAIQGLMCYAGMAETVRVLREWIETLERQERGQG